MKYLIVISLLLLPSCAMFGPSPVDSAAADLAQDVDDALADGQVDAAEVKALDRGVDKVVRALEEKRRRAAIIPKTGNPLLDWAVEIGKDALLGGATWQAVNVTRDRKRRKRGEPTGTTKTA